MEIKKDALQRIGFEIIEDRSDLRVYKKKHISIEIAKNEFGLSVCCKEKGRFTFFYVKELKAALKVIDEMKMNRGMN